MFKSLRNPIRNAANAEGNIFDILINFPGNICSHVTYCKETHLQSLGCTDVCRFLFILFEVDTEMKRKLGFEN